MRGAGLYWILIVSDCQKAKAFGVKIGIIRTSVVRSFRQRSSPISCQRSINFHYFSRVHPCFSVPWVRLNVEIPRIHLPGLASSPCSCLLPCLLMMWSSRSPSTRYHVVISASSSPYPRLRVPYPVFTSPCPCSRPRLPSSVSGSVSVSRLRLPSSALSRWRRWCCVNAVSRWPDGRDTSYRDP